jgi:hypothetical protein
MWVVRIVVLRGPTMALAAAPAAICGLVGHVIPWNPALNPCLGSWMLLLLSYVVR